MAKCYIKGCKTGATKKLIIKDDKGNTKNRPICEAHASEQPNAQIIDASSKHH